MGEVLRTGIPSNNSPEMDLPPIQSPDHSFLRRVSTRVGIGLAVGTATAVVLYEAQKAIKPVVKRYVDQKRSDNMLERIHAVAIP